MTSRYQQAGVNIDAGTQAVHLMKAAVRSTFGPQVLSDMGAFGGLFDGSLLKTMEKPVLVASMDGVGTKTKVAAQLNRWDTVGQDLVNHCINDILVQGAQPLFFLDYVASSQLDPSQIAAIVGGMAQACRAAGCALLGGETAEMPGVYAPNEVDVVGTIIGVVDQNQLIDGHRIQAGDIIMNLPSTGLHTNGFSLARHVLANVDWTNNHPDLGCSIGDALLAVHQCYLDPVKQLRQAGVDIRGLAHITGGGVIDNLPRILPPGLGATIQLGTWSIPPIFNLIQKLGDISIPELYRVLNMGLGMLVVISSNQRHLASDLTQVGEIVATHDGVKLEGA
ncbi:MAG: phosphoribosylformylglycinamidine cyclo-ligase [Chloroflexi bacterium]|nr:phosphoribosylformylglycinamidine cyclo-ligase [Chloroflexota bacterium]